MRRAVAVAGLLALVLLRSQPALAHSFYDMLCCSDKDCTPIADDEVKITKNGWFIRRTGETIPYYPNSRLRHSPDGRFHRCTISGDFSPTGHTLCLYVPDQVN
ncbi:hypothetical protein [Pararhizobium sp.]|uniref:hypothetical protein n=1 Tax=Pararhizobium sp. TaxID=1977563 RepID=UPI002725EF1D|nr:hypothetical protein [Pararhizobium sp.]MDO9415848.1 hypothetical protein [Pararhizobium sp.]